VEFPPLLRGSQRLDDLPDPIDVFEAVEGLLRARDVRAQVRALPEPQRSVIGWRYGLDGPTMTCHEVDAHLRLRPGAAYRIERRALARLRRDVTLAGWCSETGRIKS
jgi:DNA-directed RNA polymerase sigma subunit (sigma70/sigma32)